MAKFEINVDINGAASITSLDNQLKSLDKTAQTTGKGIDTASKSTDAMASSLKSLGAIIATVGLVELGRKAVQTADTMNLLEGRVSLVTKSLNEQIAVQKELFKVAQNTRQGLEATTTLYTNLATSMTAMGKSQADIIKMTETVNKAMVVSGSSTQQAQAAIMQLGQAFASGTLRGDELNSIMENSKGLAQAIANGMGVPIGKLRELGSEGKITSEILAAALEKSASDIDAKFGKLPQTVGQSLTQVQNSIMSLVGVADDAVNGTGGLSEIFSHFSKYLDQNQADVIEFGADFLRVMQLIGAGTLTTISGVQVLIHGITGGIIGAIELSINAVLLFINSAIAMAETGYNKIRSLGGFDAKALGRIKNVDLGSKSQFAGMKKDADDFNIGLKAMGSLFDDIANKTTVIKGNVADLNKKPLPDGKGGSGKSGAGKGGKEKTAEQIIKEEHDKNQAILDGIQKKTDREMAYDKFVLAGQEEKNKKAQEVADLLKKTEEDLYLQTQKLLLSDADYKKMLLDREYAEKFAIVGKTLELDKWYSDSKKAISDKEEISRLKESAESMQSIVDIQIALAESGKDWGSSLTGVAAKIASIGKTIQSVNVIGLKADKARMASQDKYNTSIIEAKGDIKKEDAAAATFNNEQGAREEAQFYAKIDAYGALAGAAGSFFEQGSSMAKAMAVVQGGLAIVSAGAGGDPYTVIPRMVAAAAMVYQALSASGISGAGGITSDKQVSDTAKYESEQASFIVDRLDRQIELLESIDRGGTAAKYKVSLAGSTFESDIAKLWAEMVGSGERAKSFITDKNINVTGNKLTDVQSVISSLTLWADTLKQEDWDWLDMTKGSVLEYQSQLEDAVNSFAINLSDVKDIVKDSSEGFKEIYDSLSGTDFYKLRDLNTAYNELGNSIVGNSKDSMLSYISGAITQMENLGKGYLETTKGILSGGTIEQQVLALNELSATFGRTFNNSTEDALNFLDSIELVAEAMVKSSENINGFIESLRTPAESAQYLAQSMGITLATSVDGLAALFKQLAYDADGLTDADLKVIEANKGLLVSNSEVAKVTDDTKDALNAQKKALDDYMSSITKGISTLEGTLSSFQSVIDNLRGSAIGSSYTLDMYRKSMSETLSLSASSDYESFSESLKNTIGYSSVLSESSMYKTSQDMKFAQLVAASQFESMQTKTLTQIDYLKMIEENTKQSSLALTDSLNALNTTSSGTTDMLSILNAQLLELIGINAGINERWVVEGNTQTWTSTGGATATGSLGSAPEAQTITSKTGQQFSVQSAWEFVNAAIASGDLMSIYTAATTHGISSTSLDALMGWAKGTSLSWALNQGLPAFLSGGYTGDVPVNNIAGITHGQEYVVNAKTTKDLGLNNSGGIFNEMKEYIKMMQNEIKNMNRAMVQLLSETTINNAGMRNVTNGYSAMMMEVI